MGSLKQALDLAERQALDAVLLCEEPPVIKICNATTHLFNSTLPELTQREVPVTAISYKITENDLKTKLRNICTCLEKQDAAGVDVSFRAKDKEAAHLKATEIAEEVKRTLVGKYENQLTIQVIEEDSAIRINLKLTKTKSSAAQTSSPTSEVVDSWHLKQRISREAVPMFEADFLDIDVRNRQEEVNPIEVEIVEKADQKTLEAKMKEREVKKILGDKLAYKVLKGKARL